MNILHLTTFLQGGAGRVIAALASAQQESGHRVTVVTSRAGPVGYGNYDHYLEVLTQHGVGVHLVDSLFARDHEANLNVVRLLAQLFPRGSEPEVIHAHAAIPSLAALLFAGSRRTPMTVVQTMHGWGVMKTASHASTDVVALNLVDRVAVPSQHSCRLLTQLGVAASRISVVPYGVGRDTCDLYDRDRQLLARMAAARATGQVVLACVGTIGDRKNQALILEALRQAPDLSVFVVFIGDGDSAGLSATIDEAGLAARCSIHGYSPAARRLAASADALLLPSRSEGQPLAVLEAFADGVIVVASDIPELAELVADGVTGLRFAAESASSLAGAVRTLCQMPESGRDAIRARAEQTYAAGFTARAMHDRYLHLYQQTRATLPAPGRPVVAA